MSIWRLKWFLDPSMIIVSMSGLLVCFCMSCFMGPRRSRASPLRRFRSLCSKDAMKSTPNYLTVSSTLSSKSFSSSPKKGSLLKLSLNILGWKKCKKSSKITWNNKKSLLLKKSTSNFQSCPFPWLNSKALKNSHKLRKIFIAKTIPWTSKTTQETSTLIFRSTIFQSSRKTTKINTCTILKTKSQKRKTMSFSLSSRDSSINSMHLSLRRTASQKMRPDARLWLMRKVVEKFKKDNRDRSFFTKNCQKIICLSLTRVMASSEKNRKWTWILWKRT